MKGHSLALAAAFAASCVFAAEAPPVVPGSVKVTTYDGITDDLLSAGLNLAGLVSAVPPGFVDPNNPTPAELRRRAIHGNYRGIVDPVPAGGMRSEEHTSELQSQSKLVCRLLLEKKKTVKAFAADVLAERPDAAAVRDRHAEATACFVERVARDLYETCSAEAAARLDRDIDNGRS